MQRGRISFQCVDVEQAFPNYRKIRNWIVQCIERERKICGEIEYVFCSDQYLLKINQDFLDHDTYTDIVTFDSSTQELIQGSLYISLDRIKENAQIHQTQEYEELLRVTIHGVLHLIGFKDKSDEEAENMRAMENKCIALYKELFG
ncbi:MAG: rRNA maturation RNase YbeY [Bacteroidales bacterium]